MKNLLQNQSLLTIKFQKMKKYYLFILIITIHFNELKSQSFCTATSKPPSANLLSVNCPLVSNPSMYNIRINFHYMLKDDGTGNFTETNDPFNSNVGYNGYRFASEIITYMNTRLSNNASMHYQPPGVTVPVLPIPYRCILNGVYYWRNTNDYDNNAENFPYLKSTYGKDIGYAINVFLVKPNGESISGAAWLDYDACFVRGQDVVFSRYLTSNDAAGSFAVFYDVTNHEILHTLNLHHTIRIDFGGACCFSDITTPGCDDGCTDTPTYPQIQSNGYTDICNWCNWDYANKKIFSNNFMDYSCWMGAMTPCQINRVTSNIINNKTCFLSCAFDTQNIDICTSPTQSKSYIARNINVIPTSCTSNSIILPVNSRIVFNCETATINKNFEVPLGTEFEIIPAVSCTN